MKKFSTDDMIQILNAVASRSEFPRYTNTWHYRGGVIVRVEQNGKKFRISTHWPKYNITGWLAPESTLKRLTEVHPRIATILADPAIDFKDK